MVINDHPHRCRDGLCKHEYVYIFWLRMSETVSRELYCNEEATNKYIFVCLNPKDYPIVLGSDLLLV